MNLDKKIDKLDIYIKIYILKYCEYFSDYGPIELYKIDSDLHYKINKIYNENKKIIIQSPLNLKFINTTSLDLFDSC
jgi:hypothetical protein